MWNFFKTASNPDDIRVLGFVMLISRDNLNSRLILDIMKLGKCDVRNRY